MTDFEPTTVCELTISATIIKKFSGKLKRLFCKNLGFNCFVAIKLFFAVTYGSVNYGRLLYYALVKQNAICYFKPTSKSLISKICECLSKSFTALSSSVLKIYSRIVSSKFQKSYLHISNQILLPLWLKACLHIQQHFYIYNNILSYFNSYNAISNIGSCAIDSSAWRKYH